MPPKLIKMKKAISGTRKVYETMTLSLIVVIVFILNSTGCSDNFEHRFRRAVSTAAADLVIDEQEYQQLMAMVEKHGEQEFIDLVSDLDLLRAYAASISNSDPEAIQIQTGQAVELERIMFYIETSASMRGYMHGGTRFQDVVHDMIGRIDAAYFNIVPFITNTVTEGIETYHSSSEYSRRLQRGEFRWGIHAPLHELFQSLLDSLNTGEITIFITDGIISGSNQEIIDNPYFNKENRTYFKNEIRRAFARHRNDLGVAIFAFTSDYNSTTAPPRRVYYDFMNRAYALPFTDRPFYVFVFGHRDLIPEFESNVLRKTAEFNYMESLHVGVHMPVQAHTRFISHLGAQQQRPNCILRPDMISADRRFGPGNPMRFAIGFNISDLPNYVQDIGFLSNHIVIEDNPDIVVSDVSVRKFDNSIRDLLNPNDRQRNVRTSHFLEITIEELYAKNSNLNVSIEMPPNEWYLRWSTDCDEGIQVDDNQTFNFKYLVDGIIEAFDANYVVRLNIPLEN